MERRRYLLAVTGGVVPFAVAGCTDDSDETTPTGTPAGTNEPTGTATEEPTGTATETNEPTGTATETNEPTGTATETNEPTGTATETNEPTETTTPSPEPPADPDQRVAVGDGLRFDPDAFEISVGETVLWEWVGSGHNVKFDEGDVPEGTDWTGTEGSRTETYGEGHTHWHAFEAAGEYRYYCVPHQSSGMTGQFTVSE